MIKFPSIEQYRNAIVSVKRAAQWDGRDENGDLKFNPAKPIPTLRFRGTVKLHGTNAGIVYDATGNDGFSYQSRERILKIGDDNAGFALFMTSKEETLLDLVTKIENRVLSGASSISKIVLFGEWCGQGIQKGVAITNCEKMFVIFAIRVVMDEDRSVWLDLAEYADIESPDDRIFNIMRFGSWDLDIDFNRPEIAQQKMVEITEAVEVECPAGKHFGHEGVGEGVVWQCITPFWLSSDYWFKVKGEKHSVSKVRTLAPVDVEAFAAIHDFVDATVTAARLEQGLQVLQNELQLPFEMKSMGDFIRWVFNDVLKEEMDTIVANQIDPKKLGGPIANKARPWFVARLNATPA